MKANIAEPLVALAVPLARLEPDPRNPRRGDTDAIARSYERFGQRKPIVARRTGGTIRAPKGTIVAGNHQYEAAQGLGWDKIAVVWVDDDDATAIAYGLADNRTSDLAAYDDAALVELLASLDTEMREATGYSDDDVRDLQHLLGSIDPTALHSEMGEPVPDALWPTITVRVPPETLAAWKAHADGFDTDALAMQALLR